MRLLLLLHWPNDYLSGLNECPELPMIMSAAVAAVVGAAHLGPWTEMLSDFCAGYLGVSVAIAMMMRIYVE